MAISLPDARELSDDVLEALRLRALHGCELGFTESQVADLLGVTRETVCRWWSAYAQGGLDALPASRTGRPLGSGRVLSDEQAVHIQRLLRTHIPEELGIAAPLWTRRAVGDLIQQGVAASPWRCGRSACIWSAGVSRSSGPVATLEIRTPRKYGSGWRRPTRPLRSGPKQEDAEIHWGDEVGVAADQQPARGYAPEGEPGDQEVPDRHIRANQISTITQRGRRFAS